MNKNRILAVIFITILIEVIGFSMIIPILPFMFTDASSAIYVLAEGTSQRTGYILLGVLFSLYTFAQFFSNPVFGQYSDKYGRRPLLMGSILGTSLSNFGFAYAVSIVSLPLMFVMRFVDGITGGSIAIAQSVVADISDKKSRAKNFGIAAAAVGLGFMIGPVIGAVLSDTDIVPWFGPAFAFVVSGIFSLINVFLLRRFLLETSPKDHTLKINIVSSVKNIAKIFTSLERRTLYGTAFIYSFGFTLFTSFFGVILLQQFNYTQTHIGFFFLYIGVLGILFYTQLIPYLDKRFHQYPIIIIGSLLLSLTLGMISFIHTTAMLLVVVFIFSAANSITGTGIAAVISRNAHDSQQGEVLGLKASSDALGQAIPALIAGILAAMYGPNFPLEFAAVIFLFMAGLVFWKRKFFISERE
jgi:DHA1 family tetracycline resistance protein-like MFS transporter